ncbi:hypothetical protein AB205_0189850 [Aquarana catesbeiana]|uniref:Uncharacterized protein n=1 Tax=Aquarana catesbeiana TaxID=8400 RepID=A0A2G9RC20_AQUCT|nr:hypothetical protein AB205_0189850 [Aquarana catesbeiana]
MMLVCSKTLFKCTCECARSKMFYTQHVWLLISILNTSFWRKLL